MVQVQAVELSNSSSRQKRVDPCNRKVVHVIEKGGKKCFAYNNGPKGECFTETTMLVAESLLAFAPARFDMQVFSDGFPQAVDCGTLHVDNTGCTNLVGMGVLLPTRGGLACRGFNADEFALRDRIEITLPDHFT